MTTQNVTSPGKTRRAPWAGLSRRLAALASVIVPLLLFAQSGGRAAPLPISLDYSNGFLVTGNYVVGTIDLPQQSGGNGFLTGTINMTGASAVPAGAEILSAFLYWETITSEDPSQRQLQLNGVKFRGLGVDAVNIAYSSLTGATASCWSSGGGSGSAYTMNEMRADVRRLLPVDATGRRLVNDADLQANGYPLNQVTLPEAGTGNQVPQSAGASLVVIYRLINNTEPLRKIVIYDSPVASGHDIAILPNTAGATFAVNLRGIYQSEPNLAKRSARLTHIVGSGQPNDKNRVFFNGVQMPVGFQGTSVSSDRSWQSVTYDVSALMPGTTPTGPLYGEQETTTVDHTNTSPYDCISWGAVIFSAAVKDDDHDGIPDGIEDAVGGLIDADGTPLPDLNALHASSSHKDIFIQMDAMRAAPGTSYGSESAPYNSKKCIIGGNETECTVTDLAGHSHIPTAAAVKILIDAYKNAPIVNTGWPGADGSSGIFPHIDVGDPTNYISILGTSYTNNFFPAGPQAKGGKLVWEESPVCDSAVPCQFSAFPGTVSWLQGFSGYSNALFDRVREGLVHWVFYVHARGFPKSLNRCLDPVTGTNPDGTCNVVNRDYYVPTSQSGVAQLPGGKAMISLGLWDTINFVGTPEFNASTTLHELGHNVNLQHGGGPPTRTATSISYEPNCKPNYLSVMNYSFVAAGMRDDNGVAHFDYSRDSYSNVDENFLSDGLPASPLRFRTAWFASLNSPLAVALGATRANRYCSGAPLPNPLPNGWVDMARVELPNVADSIDWNGDDTIGGAPPQDVNFDGVLSGGNTPLRGFNDWANIRLDQTGGGVSALNLSQGSLRVHNGSTLLRDGSIVQNDGSITLNDGSIVQNDGSITLNDGSIVQNDGSITLNDGSIVQNDGSIQLNDGSIVFNDGSIVFNDGSIVLNDASIVFNDGSIRMSSVQEQTTQHFADLGHAPPQELTACVIGINGCGSSPPMPFHRTSLTWKAPNVSNAAGAGTLVGYYVYRFRGVKIQPSTVIFQLTPMATPVTGTAYVDTEELPNNQVFTYYVKAVFDDTSTSGASNFKFITAVNDAAHANNNNYTTLRNTALTGNVVTDAPGNDTDSDSPLTALRAVLVSGVPAGHTLTLNPNGSFTYTPKNGFTSTVSFTYKMVNGTWTRDLPNVPMSPDSNVATVTITVNAPTKP
jgi:hypothetical protein